MIRILNNAKGFCTWSIYGTTIKLVHKASRDDLTLIPFIEEYKIMLENNSYIKSNDKLCELFLFFEKAGFIRIGYLVFQEDFLRMYRYYAVEYARQSIHMDLKSSTHKIPYTQMFHMMTDNAQIKFSYRYYVIFLKLGCREVLKQICEEEFSKVWIDKISLALQNEEKLHGICKKIGAAKTAKYSVQPSTELMEKYILSMAESFTRNRELIVVAELFEMLFGCSMDYALNSYDEIFQNVFNKVINEETSIQYTKFLVENHLQLNVQSDKWVLYKKHGPTLSCRTIDFLKINSPSLRLELKYFLRHRLKGFRNTNDSFFEHICSALNILVSKNPQIRYFADITEVDARTLCMAFENDFLTQNNKKVSVATLADAMHSCRLIIVYLMSDMRDNNLKTPIPHQNPFLKFKLTNVRDYKQNTPIIPENIMLQLDEHSKELSEIHKLFYDIFSNTGMRLKEVQFLEEDCIEKTKYENLYQIKYKPYKVLAARRKAGLSDYHRVMVPKTLTDDLKKYIKKTSDLRIQNKSPFIFINKRSESITTMITIGSFMKSVNNLITKHDIFDENGVLWNFTSRQMRKTTAVTLIENGATTEELTYWLGHLSKDTAALYYAEVRKMKLAEMNTQFFKDKFDLLLSNEQLQAYSEEERRLLYIDFCLDGRRVEFGYCLKKLADGGCSERNALYNCVGCKNLCNGGKYLPYWQELLMGQEKIVQSLLNIYKKNGIDNYSEFQEYKKEDFLLQCYQNVVDSIVNKEAAL